MDTDLPTVDIVKARGSGEAPLGLYLHVPFCSSTCDFCAFYQEKPKRGDFERYVEGVGRELDLLSWDRPVGTVFWGGGTPGLLPPKQIERLGTLIRSKTGGSPFEWTVEMTPGSVGEGRLAALSSIGVNRISLGAQSFQPPMLENLGRLHSREKVFAAYEKIRAAGFLNVNIDLMFALPGQELNEWEEDMAEALRLRPDHLSTYCLTFEEDTALWVKLSRGEVKLDVEKEAAFFECTRERLEAGGLIRYETSNYARRGSECAHNRNTWRMHEWIGIGPAASSQNNGYRYANPADLDAWLNHLVEGRRGTEDRVRLSPQILAADYLVFGLRMSEGVDLDLWKRRFQVQVPDRLTHLLLLLEENHLARREKGRILQLTSNGHLLADRIGAEILEVL